MAKKIKVEETTTEDQKVINEDISTKKSKTKKVESSEKTDKKPAKKQKKDKKSLVKKMKETTSELKKVSWPSFGKVVKQTGIVIVVVTICTLLLFGIDNLFSLFYNLLTK